MGPVTKLIFRAFLFESFLFFVFLSSFPPGIRVFKKLMKNMKDVRVDFFICWFSLSLSLAGWLALEMRTHIQV
jgi:hypothetical protein